MAYQVTSASGQAECSPGPSISISVVTCLYVRGGAIESSCCKLLTSEFVLLNDWALSDSSELASWLLLGTLNLMLPYYQFRYNMLFFVDQCRTYSYRRRIYKIRKTTTMIIVGSHWSHPSVGCARFWSSWLGGVLFNIIMIARWFLNQTT
jgi:hypothetical protein